MSEKQLIYKEKALEILDDFQSDIENCIPYAYSTARARMAGLYPRSEWTPCSERLPSEETSVLVTFGYGEIGIDIHTVGWANNGWIWHDDVIAWMPLPKPYEETDHE